MTKSTLEQIGQLSSQLPEKIPYLKMLVLFGSRARGDTHAKSDWDFAVTYDEKLREESCKDRSFAWFEIPVILEEIFQINSDQIDVVELNHCSPLIGFHVARDGKVLYEEKPGDFAKFQLKAWKHYADTAKFRKLQRHSIELWLQKWGV
jgi:predicted nucleotidyltransferase